MDLRRLRIGDWITGLGGLVLLLSLWAPWYAVGDGDLTAWAAFGLIDLWLLLTALLALAVPVGTALKDSPAVPVALDVITWAVSLIALILVLIRLLAEPHGDVVTGREWGSIAGTLAVLAVFAGAWLAMRDESAPAIRQPERFEPMSAPPPGAGPEPTRLET
jgi:hypothetical protein